MISKREPIINENLESTFTGYTFQHGKSLWNVVVVHGKINHITVRKPSPWKTLGKDFEDFNEAVKHYKNPTIKLYLRLIEMNLI